MDTTSEILIPAAPCLIQVRGLWLEHLKSERRMAEKTLDAYERDWTDTRSFVWLSQKIQWLYSKKNNTFELGLRLLCHPIVLTSCWPDILFNNNCKNNFMHLSQQNTK